MRILFIDDKADEMQVHKRELEASGHSVKFIDHLDKAFEALSQIKNQIIYDAVFVDHDFSGNQGDIPNGKALIAKLKAESLLCPIIYFSAIQGDVKEVTNVIASLGACTFYDKKSQFDGKQNKCMDEIKELSSFIRIIELRKSKIDKELPSFFQSLSQQQAYDWQQEADKGERADWKSFGVSIFDGKFNIAELLYSPVRPLQNEEITNIIEGYLKAAGKYGKFNAYFEKDSKEVFNKYVQNRENDKSRTESEISNKSINYLLDVLNIFGNILKNDETIYSLNVDNQAISVATIDIGGRAGKKGIEKQRELFKKKLILRRVLAAIYYSISSNIDFEAKYELDLMSKSYKFLYLCCLLKEGYTHPSNAKTKKRQAFDFLTSDQAKPSYNRIGFNIESLEEIYSLSKTEISDKPFRECLLEEETVWIKSFSNLGYKIRCALDEIYNDALRNKLKVELPNLGFSDLNHFKSWYSENVTESLFESIFNSIKIGSGKFNVQHYFKEYIPTEIAHFGAGKLGLGLVAPIITQLGDKVVIINRNNENWEKLSITDSLEVENNGQCMKFDYYHQDLSDDKKKAIKEKWTSAPKMQLIVVTNNAEDIKFFIKDVQHITTSLKKGLNWAKQIINDASFSNLVTIYPFENDKKDVEFFYKDLDNNQFEQALLIADRVCTDTLFDNNASKLMVFAEEYGHVVIKGNKLTNLFAKESKINGIEYIFCENEDEFMFYFEKKFRILNCVHASLAVLCYDKVLNKQIPGEKWGEQYLNLLKDDTEIKKEIEKIAVGEIIKLMATSNPGILEKIYPGKTTEEVFLELKAYSNSIFNRFDKMADRLDRVLKLDDLITKFDDRINDTITFFVGGNKELINAIIDKISIDKPDVKQIDKTLRELLIKVSNIIRTRNKQ